MAAEDLRIYEHHLLWLLGEIAGNLRETDLALLAKAPPIRLEGNNMLAVARHAAGATRAYVLGMGCGLPAARDRAAEFTANASDFEAILTSVESLKDEIRLAFVDFDAARLDVPFTPERSLYGTGEIREMTPRDAIVNSIRHLGIHLGELRITRSLLES